MACLVDPFIVCTVTCDRAKVKCAKQIPYYQLMAVDFDSRVLSTSMCSLGILFFFPAGSLGF